MEYESCKVNLVGHPCETGLLIQRLQTGGNKGRKPRAARTPKEKWQIIREATHHINAGANRPVAALINARAQLHEPDRAKRPPGILRRKRVRIVARLQEKKDSIGANTERNLINSGFLVGQRSGLDSSLNALSTAPITALRFILPAKTGKVRQREIRSLF